MPRERSVPHQVVYVSEEDHNKLMELLNNLNQITVALFEKSTPVNQPVGTKAREHFTNNSI